VSTENFRASVQYNDLKGTAAADRHDKHDLTHYLEEKHLIQDGEMLVGIEMSSLEVHARNQDEEIYVAALVARYPSFDNLQGAMNAGKTLHVRRIRLEMKLNEFFGFFKRFQVSISNGGIMDGRQIVIDS